MTKKKLRSLLKKLGTEENAKIILRDFYQRMSEDILIGYFFFEKDTNQIADRQLEFISFAAGLRKTYSGHTPTSAHLKMPPILVGHFDRRLIILRETLQAHGLALEDIETWVAFENAFRNVVVSPT